MSAVARDDGHAESMASPGSWAALLEADAESLYDHAPCGHLSALPDGTIVNANATFLTWIGRDSVDVIGRLRLQDFLTPAGRIYHETHLMPLLLMHGAAREISLEIVAADHTRRPVLLTSALVSDGDGTPSLIRVTVFEASERREYERELQRARDRERASRELAERLQRDLAERNRELEQLAYTDPLTGLDNRRALEAHLERATARASRHREALGIALLDLDNFKRINDELGHDAGDAVLKATAERIRRAVRREDITGRWGGEEFLIIAPSAGNDGMDAIAERVRAAIEASPVQVDGRAIACTASIGWVTWAGEPPGECVARADSALYLAKQAGRNCVRAGVDR